MSADKTLFQKVADTVAAHDMATANTPALLMVSGGSDSTALAYLAADLVAAGRLGAVTMLHVNHKIRGEASDADAAFVAKLARRLGMPLFVCDVDIPALVANTGANMEAVARMERYRAAHDALESMCNHMGFRFEDARVFAAHTADDRVENFFMRSIVGTGPGGFRAMEHCSRVEGCMVCRPLLDVGREELRAYIQQRDGSVADETGALWREDATNLDTDRFRAFVRHEIIPVAKQRNPKLLDTLTRTMNLIAEEDDMLAQQARTLLIDLGQPLGYSLKDGVLLSPKLAEQPKPLARRVFYKLLDMMLPAHERVEAASVEACVKGLGNSGYTANIQGNLAVSYNKEGLRIEPMEAYRARRNRM